MSSEQLAVEKLTVYLANRATLQDVTLNVRRGQIVALFGHNGAGKSTLLRAIMGVIPIRSGIIRLDFAAWTNNPHILARAGVSFLPQQRQLFTGMTVVENLLVYSEAIGQTRQEFDEKYSSLSKHFPVLSENRNSLARSLSGGQAQQVAIARTFFNTSHLLLLDEPTIGLAPHLRQKVFGMVHDAARTEAVSVIIAEHRIEETLAVADYAYVLRQGRVSISGASAELRMKGQEVQQAIM
jgi:branched-chain amino acid transport system ATP-binding protein